MNNELIAIQSELKAPKNQWNDYGKYYYRNAEDIMEALKPLLKKHKSQFFVTDSIEQVGERYYIKATGRFESESGVVEVSAYAREPEQKKGMDESMVTGATSSFARKYMMNGLFLIDDTKDSDSVEGRKEAEEKAKAEEKRKQKKGLVTDDRNVMLQVASEYYADTKQTEKVLEFYKVDDFEKLSDPDLIQAYNRALEGLERKKAAENQKGE